MKMKVSMKQNMAYTSRAIEALVEASKVRYSKQVIKANNKYGWIEVIYCNGYTFKSSKAFGLYLIDLINSLSGCGIVDYQPIESAHMANNKALTFFIVE
jgi:hypothetical protein